MAGSWQRSKRTLILAGSFTEAAHYAKSTGLKLGTWSTLVAPEQIRGAFSRVVQLVGYRHRRDYHAMQAELLRAERKGLVPGVREVQGELYDCGGSLPESTVVKNETDVPERVVRPDDLEGVFD